jgi:polyisoprenoid-binding protein YceI
LATLTGSMKGYLISLFLLPILAGSAVGQRLQTKNGEISFTSNAQLEVISASSNKVMGIINTATSEFAFKVDVRSFNGFNSELQRQHFYENYMETEKFPTASFSGKIIEQIDFSQDGTYEVRAKGDLDIHGEKQTRIIKCKVILKNGAATLDSRFLVPLIDHNIKIPKIVNQKIATDIEVIFKAVMTTQLAQ